MEGIFLCYREGPNYRDKQCCAIGKNTDIFALFPCQSPDKSIDELAGE